MRRESANTLPPQTISPLGQRLRFTILGLQRSGNRMLTDLLREVSLTPSQAEIITILAEHETLTLRQLGQLLVCEVGSPSRAIDLLVNRGLVLRETSSRDRRSINLTLTEHARTLLPTIRAADHALETWFNDCLTSDEQHTLTTLLNRLTVDPSLRHALDQRFPPSAEAADPA